MERRHRCRLCLRGFENGRALGGHIRSHKMKFFEKRDGDLSYSSPSETGDFPDGESEAESSPPPRIRRRSRRIFEAAAEEEEDLSSISETTPEEQLAHCLIMLSRDHWERDFLVSEEEEEQGKFSEEFSEDSGQEKVIKSGNKVKEKYKCEACNKIFKSYQALGGHRASHKKVKLSGGGSNRRNSSAGGKGEVKLHQCPFCHRIFPSGQALGGHKRTHFLAGGSPPTEVPKPSEALNIDLNLPAPGEEDGSALSDGELVHTIQV